MSQRLSLICQVTTAPSVRSEASPHTGGWSESLWTQTNLPADSGFIRRLAQKRAALMPEEAAVIGFRLANYTLIGNKIVPTGSASGKFLYPGRAGERTDLPQVALEMSGTSEGATNTSRFAIRCIPDAMMTGGEYQPTSAFAAKVRAYCKMIEDDSWWFLGRDLTQPSARVLSFVQGVLELNGPIGAVVGDFVRLNRVKTVAGIPVTGAYRVNAVNGNNLTLAGSWNLITCHDGGSARKDLVALRNFATVAPVRAVVRKIGRPFESYRGRASKAKAR